jgi:hypothetical protein
MNLRRFRSRYMPETFPLSRMLPASIHEPYIPILKRLRLICRADKVKNAVTPAITER